MVKSARVLLDNSLVNGRTDRVAQAREIIRRSHRGRIHQGEVSQATRLIDQPQSQYFVPAVSPGETTTVRLSGGKYCLGTESTVPFVSLSGGGMAQKIISWGEMVEVPADQMITIKNESFHQGDIAINSGWDYATRPGKVTVPVPLIDAATGAQLVQNLLPATPFTIVPNFPVDTRIAKRAWLVPQITTDADDLTLIGFGRQIKHSFPASAFLNGYTNFPNLPSFTAILPIPLGASFGTNSNLPMALADQFSWTLTVTDFALLVPIWFYVLEYN